MKVGIFISTPAQVHFYKNIIKKLENDGNDVFVVARGYGDTIDLLNEMKIPYFTFSHVPNSKSGKILSVPGDVLRAYRFLKDNRVSVVTGYGIYNALASRLLGATDVIFNDSEPMANSFSYDIQVRLCMLLTNAMISPSSFRQSLGRKHIKVDSYKEMAYLHPNYYRPDDSIYRLLGISPQEDYVLLRFNAFDAVHDFGVKGFRMDEKVRLVRELEKYAKVFVSSEMAVPDEIKKNLMTLPKNRIHDAIYFAKMLVTDTQTMATEGALLGTPTIRCNSFVGPRDMGNFIELEEKYGLIYNFSDRTKAIEKAVEMAKRKDLAAEWQQKMSAFMSSSIDINNFMTWFIESYPASLKEIKHDPGVQYRFRRADKKWPKSMPVSAGSS